MRFGRFASFPIRLGGGRSEAERIYEGMRTGRGERFSKDDDADENITLRCQARQIAIASSYQRRGAYQAQPTLATDCLPDWERRLGVVRNPRDNEYARRRLLDAILAGNGPPDSDSISTALSRAVGETVTVVTAEAPSLKTRDTVLHTPTTPLTAISGGRLNDGTHHVVVAWETPTHIVLNAAVTQNVDLVTGQGIRTGAFPLSLVTDAYAVHFYMSVAAGSTSLAWVATTTGGAVDIYDYPSNPGDPALHHVTAIVSASVLADQGKRQKIHEVLGSMLPAWTDYDIATSSPFLLDESHLGEDAL